VEISSNNDVMFRGESAAKGYLGLCSLRCSVWLDDEPLMENGEYVPQHLKADGFRLNSAVP